jgi:hypothetical protein
MQPILITLNIYVYLSYIYGKIQLICVTYLWLDPYKHVNNYMFGNGMFYIIVLSTNYV